LKSETASRPASADVKAMIAEATRMDAALHTLQNTDTAQRKAAQQAAQALYADRMRSALEQMEVEHINRGKLGLRVGLLRDHGIQTIWQLSQVGFQQLCAIDGLGEQSARKILDTTRQIIDHTKETIRKTVTACADLDIPLLMLPFFWDSMLDEKDADLLKNAEQVLKYAGEVGADHGVTVAIESTLSAKRTIDLLCDVQSDWVKVFYDTQNTRYFRGADTIAEIRQYGDLIAQVHVKDGEQGLLGELPIGTGHARCQEALSALKEIGYAGPLLLETHYDRVVFKNPAADLYELARDDLRRTAAILA